MKLLSSFLFAIAMIIGIQSQAQITATEAHFTITGETSREQLAQIAQELHAQGIKFVYRPSFDPNRRLTGIDFNIVANEGQLTGADSHKTLQNPNASLTIHINKTNGTFSTDVVGDLSRQ